MQAYESDTILKKVDLVECAERVASCFFHVTEQKSVSSLLAMVLRLWLKDKTGCGHQATGETITEEIASNNIYGKVS